MKIKDLVITALFIAIVAVVTLVANIPIPGTRGYVNASEVAVFSSVLILRDKRAWLASGLGASLADVILGYTFYAPATLIVKGLEAWVATKALKIEALPQAVALAIGALVMPLGYFLFEWVFLYRNLATAFLGLGPNLLQGYLGMAATLLVYPLVQRGLESSRIGKDQL